MMTKHGQSFFRGNFPEQQYTSYHKTSPESNLIKNTEGRETQVKPKPTQAG